MSGTDTQTKTRVVLAEDHQVSRQGLRNIIDQSSDFAVVGEASDGEQALEVVKSCHPDILLCDIRLPLLSGIRVARQVKKLSPQTRTVILSAYDDDEYVLELLGAGAAGYLLKTMTSDELLEALRKARSGSTILHPEIASKIARIWAEGVPPKNRQEELTVRETEILSLAGEGLSNRVIADRLNLSVRTVEKHFDNMLGKLSVSSRHEAVRYGLKQRIIDIISSGN